MIGLVDLDDFSENFQKGGGGKRKSLLGFFINHVIFGVFQYDLGPPKHTLELRNFVLINVFSLHLIGPNGENWGFEGVFISFSYTFFRLFQV